MNLLEKIKSRRTTRKVFRLAIQQTDDKDHADFWNEQQFDQQQFNDMKLEGYISEIGSDPEELLERPFQPKRHIIKQKNRTRFSNGDFLVFYSSLDPDTAESEVKFRLPAILGNPQNPRTAHFQLFHCTFDGIEMDLRAKTQDWPDLMHESDYTFCNRIGAEAVDRKLDGIVTFSVRRKDGVNVPIFTRDSISNAVTEVILEMTYDPKSGNTTVRNIEGGN